MSINLLMTPQYKKLTDGYFDFQPDLIIEATNACDRACSGCYAANILVKGKTPSSSAQFLSSETLELSLKKIGRIPMLTIRGGEPSIHPSIEKILEVAATNSEMVVLETHGRWIKQNASLLDACRKNGIFIKISFDSMHGLSATKLYEAHTVLIGDSINYLLAITEPSYEDFLETRSLCPWVLNSQIIYQKKAVSLDELIKPRIGVVKVDGTLKATLSVKNNFLDRLAHV